MDQVARLSARERSALFSETAARMGTTPAVEGLKMFRKSILIFLVAGCLSQSGCIATGAAVGATVGGGIGTAVGAVGQVVTETVKLITKPLTSPTGGP